MSETRMQIWWLLCWPPSFLKTNKQKVVFKKFKELVPCPIIYTILTIKYVQTKTKIQSQNFRHTCSTSIYVVEKTNTNLKKCLQSPWLVSICVYCGIHTYWLMTPHFFYNFVIKASKTYNAQITNLLIFLF